MSSLAAAPSRRVLGRRRAALAATLAPSSLAIAAGVAVALAALALAAQGGQTIGRGAWADIGLTLAGAGLAAAALVAAPPARRAWGIGTLWLFAALAAWTALSIVWSLFPSDSWLEANRTLSYLFTFAGGMALARLAPARWRALLAGVLLATVAVSAYALATKVFPGSLAPDEIYARLRAPFGYWNATGLWAALGVPAALWLGARREGHPAVAALAYPALGLLLITVLLAYSRGALLALAVGVVLWFAVVPLRLRAVAVLAVAAVPTGLAAAWAFGRPALTTDNLGIPVRAVAGHQLGVLLLVLVLWLAAAGLLVSYALAQGPISPRARWRTGVAVLSALALGAVVGLAALQATGGGLGSRLSRDWHQLTDTRAQLPGNDPSRLTAVASVRARYWDESLKVWRAQPWVGAGAGAFATARLRYSRDQLVVRHSHGYVVQTLADLGIVGLVLSLLALGAWAWAARRPAPLRARGRPPAAERAGMLTLLAVVVVFGVHSLVDWTWFIPGTAAVGLLCAGWLAGRGPLESAAPAPEAAARRRRWAPAPPRLAGALGVVALGLLVAWTALQPLRAQQRGDAALAAAEKGDFAAARAAARQAHDRNPLSPDPYFDLATVEDAAGRTAAARVALERAVRLVPSSPETWRRLGEYELDVLDRPRTALRALSAAVALAPNDPTVQGDFLRARRAVNPLTATGAND